MAIFLKINRRNKGRANGELPMVREISNMQKKALVTKPGLEKWARMDSNRSDVFIAPHGCEPYALTSLVLLAGGNDLFTLYTGICIYD